MIDHTQKVYSRDVVSNNVGQLPNNKTTIRSNTSKPISKNCHVGDLRLRREDTGKLQQRTITAGPRNNPNTAFDIVSTKGKKNYTFEYSPLVIEYATQ